MGVQNFQELGKRAVYQKEQASLSGVGTSQPLPGLHRKRGWEIEIQSLVASDLVNYAHEVAEPPLN